MIRFGPLHLVSSFAFEGMLKFCGSLLHGTRGFGSQLGHHLAAESYLNFQAESEITKMENLRLKSFCDQKTKSLKNGLLGKLVQVTLREIMNENCCSKRDNFDLFSNVLVGKRAKLNKIGIYLSLI